MNLSIVFFIISCIIGSGIFFIPFDLQFFGINSFFSTVIISLFCIYLTYLFSKSSEESLFKLIDKYLGSFWGFLSAWIYWVVGWTSTIIIIGEMYRYLCRILPYLNDYAIITKCFFVSFFIFVNCFKNKFQNILEITINILKIIPMLIFPILCFYNKQFSLHNLTGSVHTSSIVSGLPQIIWCFMGVECAAIVNKKPKATLAMILGVILVTIIYLTNLIGIFGIMGYKLPSYTPYADIMALLFGQFGLLMFSWIVFIVTIGALNVWIVSSGAVAVDNSKLGYFPKWLQKTNKSGANYLAVIVSAIGLIPLCFFETNTVLKKGVGMASNGVMIFYMLYCLAYYKKNKSIGSLFATICCGIFLFLSSSMAHFILIGGVILLGLPLFFLFKQQSKNV